MADIFQRRDMAQKAVTIPEHNILQIMNKIEILEKKMSDTSVFLALYNEMKDLEAKFIEAVQNAESNTYALSEQAKKRIKIRKDKILKRR